MEEFIGIIKLFGGNFAPQGWAFCNGQLMSIAQNSALFSILGTTYGGDGVTTFGLPDLRSRVAVGMGQGPGLSNYVQGQMAGTENVTLLANQMPAHTHMLNASSQPGATNAPAGGVLALPVGSTGGGEEVTVNAFGTAPDTTLNPASVGVSGGNMPHENLQPYLALNYIICLEGIYPSRS
ncbi:phage tail protein [Hymenobacter sp. B81]|uniref:phage tail protein n=1 Tax=Hymenobacter sp. B81 TaxID=3344878 RepID=UPI0037DC8CA2